MAKKYIDADRLRAEIENLIERYGSIKTKGILQEGYMGGRLIGYEDALNKLDSLQQEQPEVDLEKEIEEHAERMPMSEFTHDSEVEEFIEWAKQEFRHFFELGLNARKEENK